MRKLLAIATVFSVVATAAMAQTPPAQNGPQNGATNSKDQQVNAPVKGRNSFTEGEAKSRIEARGFTNISQLQKDDNGVWRGRAMKDGKPVVVSLDYQGNVLAGDSSQGTTAPANPRGSAGR
jgi:hypothetical protein